MLAMILPAILACHEAPPRDAHEPMRPLQVNPARDSPMTLTANDEPAATASPPPLAERPPADPAITKAIDLISASGLRFIDQAEDDSKPGEYTAEQFASMLRTKWDWIGYDIVELDPWLEEIAARSFKTNLPYQVVLANGARVELRGWLEQQLAAGEDP
ncbi:hypothetical protein DB30_01619 [Enhygromyxa salina]|uniref:Uncharacterized protein n=1 Tax=Enhygromyxa salina TaxID=215803 RepID=A0A0C1ZMM2_9BACT|nr:hypothetical protein DB30_01619 [Enhygromyxa salina]